VATLLPKIIEKAQRPIICESVAKNTFKPFIKNQKSAIKNRLSLFQIKILL